MDGSSSKEHLLRSASAESANLRQDLEAALRAKDNALQENRRLQDDLAACTADCRSARNELEVCKRQIEDLKRQLQHYVAEVKKFEDLMTQKETERNDLLDQFRSLSQEASMLENNNHTLENEAAESKVQLSVTLDHVADLETKLNGQDGAISSYEKQIAELTSQIANLENQLGRYRQQQEHTEADLAALRDLCMKLDKQKDTLVLELNAKDEQTSKITGDMLRLRRESDTLQSSLSKDRMSVANLERLLAEARQETVQQKLYSEELQAEIKTLKARIEDFQQKLSPATATFTYSANAGPVLNNEACTCCACCAGKTWISSQGNVIDTSSFTKKCCGKCSSQLALKKQLAEVKTNGSVLEPNINIGSLRKTEVTRKSSSLSEKILKQLRNSYTKPQTSATGSSFVRLHNLTEESPQDAISTDSQKHQESAIPRSEVISKIPAVATTGTNTNTNNAYVSSATGIPYQYNYEAHYAASKNIN